MNCSGISRDTLLGRAIRAPLRALPRGLVVPVLQGRLRGKRWIVGSGVHGYWVGSYEWHKRKLFERTVRPGHVVFDVGANVGFYTLLASELVGRSGRVVAFEPVERNLRFLRTHLALNRVRNVTVIAAALWDRPGLAAFDTGPDTSQGRVTEKGAETVRTVTLDDLWRSGEIPAPDVVKMDIEGAELHALRGATQMLTQSSPVILLATHGDEVRGRCFELLLSVGYRIRPIAPCADPSHADEFVARRDPLPVPGSRPGAEASAAPADHHRGGCTRTDGRGLRLNPEPPVEGSDWLLPPGEADLATDPTVLRRALGEAARMIEAADSCR